MSSIRRAFIVLRSYLGGNLQMDANSGRLITGRRHAALNALNANALAARAFIKPGYRFHPVSANDAEFHALAKAHPYFGIVEVSILGEAGFLMLSMNDDIVARVYLLFGPDAYETLSVAAWTRLAAAAKGRIVDVGAFAGLYTLAARSANPKVKITAFEPMSLTRARLMENLGLNRLQNDITVEPFAVSDHDGTARMNVTHGITQLDAGASLAKKTHRRTEEGDTVKVVSLDQYFSADNVELIKIDVELHEMEALAGARSLITRCRPAVLCEVSKTLTLAPVCSFFDEIGYRLFLVDDRRMSLLPSADVREIDRNVFNVLAVARDEHEACITKASDRLSALYPQSSPPPAAQLHVARS